MQDSVSVRFEEDNGRVVYVVYKRLGATQSARPFIYNFFNENYTENTTLSIKEGLLS